MRATTAHSSSVGPVRVARFKVVTRHLLNEVIAADAVTIHANI